MNKASGGVVFDRVSKRYGELTVVDEVSFTVSPGELVTLLGPSGCGKTTTLRMVAGLEPVSDGRIAIGGTDVTLRAANERDVSMVFQSYALFPHMTVLENVCYGPLSTSSDKAQARKLAHAKLEMLGLAGLGDRLPSELSGGQQQRVAVARSLVLEPAVLLFDEPLSNLDAKLRRRVRQEIRDLQQSLELTVIYVTHDQEEALAVSDQIIVMEAGKIAQKGSPHELYEAPASRFLADFIGDANLVDGELTAEVGGRVFAAGGARMPVQADDIAPGPATLAVRPNRLHLGAPGPGSVPGVCKRAAYLGSRIEYLVDTPWGELLVFDDKARKPRPRDEKVGVTFDPDAAIVLRR
jgi:iron(III) transport system ATP-binding protein